MYETLDTTTSLESLFESSPTSEHQSNKPDYTSSPPTRSHNASKSCPSRQYSPSSPSRFNTSTARPCTGRLVPFRPHLSLVSRLALTRHSSSTLPLHHRIPHLDGTVRRRKEVQTLCECGLKLCGCTHQVDQRCLEAIFLWDLAQGRSGDDTCRELVSSWPARAREGGGQALGS